MPSRERPIRPGDPISRTARDANRTKDTIEKSLHRQSVQGPMSIDTAYGSITAPDYPRLGLFQIPINGTWRPGGITVGLPGPCSDVAGNTTDVGADPLTWAYMSNCKSIWYDVPSGTYVDTTDPMVETLWHINAYPGDHGPLLRSLHHSTCRFPARYGPEDYVWAYFNQQSGRWEILEMYEDIWRYQLIDDISIGGYGTAYLRLSTQNVASPGPGQWVTTTYFFTVHDSQELGPFRQGDLGFAKRFGDSNRWEILGGQDDSLEIVLAEVTNPSSSSGAQGTCNALLPNGNASCKIYYYDSQTGQCNYDYFDVGTLYDRHNSNFLLSGEKVMGVLRRCNSTYHVDILGSHGLFRFGKALFNIACDASGNVKILGVDLSSTPGLSSSGGSVSGQSTCVGLPTNCTVNVCNAMGYTHPIEADDEVPIRYIGNIWVVLPHPYPTNAEGVLLESLCPDIQGVGGSGIASSSGAGANIGQFKTTDYCGRDPTSSSSGILAPSSYNNKYKLCGQSGDIVSLYWNKNSREWVIDQIVHKQRTVVTDHRDKANCIELGYQLICVPACDDEKEWENLLCGAPCPTSSGSSGTSS